MAFTWFFGTASNRFCDFQSFDKHGNCCSVMSTLHQVSCSIVKLLSTDVQSDKVLILLWDHFWCSCWKDLMKFVRKSVFVLLFRQFVRQHKFSKQGFVFSCRILFLFVDVLLLCHGCIMSVLRFCEMGNVKFPPLLRFLDWSCLAATTLTSLKSSLNDFPAYKNWNPHELKVCLVKVRSSSCRSNSVSSEDCWAFEEENRLIYLMHYWIHRSSTIRIYLPLLMLLCGKKATTLEFLGAKGKPIFQPGHKKPFTTPETFYSHAFIHHKAKFVLVTRQN